AFPESRRALLLASHWGGPEPKRRKSVNMNSRSFELITRTTSTFTRQPVMLQRAASIAQARSSSRGINPALVRLGSVVTAVFGFLLAMQPMRAASILWVSDAPPDIGFSGAQLELTDGGFVRLLQGAGHTVERYDNPESNATSLTPEEIARINTNDLIIIGRATASGQFQEGQGDQWNTNIIKQMICMSRYLDR